MRSLPAQTVVTIDDLRKEGIDGSQLRSHLRGWHRLERGVYAREIPDSPDDAHLLRARAALRRFDATAVLSHQTAAVMWGLPARTTSLDRVRLSRIGRLSTPEVRRPGVVMSGSSLSRRDVVAHEGVRVTSSVRTVLDCARTLPIRAGVSIADAAAASGLLPEADVRRILSEMKGWKGVGRARHVLALVDPAAESPGESSARVVLRGLGHRVTSQFEIRDGGNFVARVDFLVEDTRVVVEFDGRGKYGMGSGDVDAEFWAEKRRHDAIVAAGYEVVRLTWEDLADPREVDRLVTRARERSRQRYGR